MGSTGDELCHHGPADTDQVGGCDGEDVPGRSGRSPDLRECQECLVRPDRHRRQMADRGDAADSEPGRRADLIGIGASQRFARKRRGARRINPLAARRQKQADASAGFGPEDDRLDDLIDCAACFRRRLFSCAGLGSRFVYAHGHARCSKGRFDPLQTSAHPMFPFRGQKSGEGRATQGVGDGPCGAAAIRLVA
jgi:hypothetical protein